jgi:hypothetical protein
MGVVYEVFDREREELVAAKTLLHFEPGALYQFKQEFRTLADVRHPNLVRFHEFVQRGDNDVFFTMERVRGVDFLRYVRSQPGDLGHLRRALRQLVDGVAALHEAGKLHRDIKPSNVLVTEEGRVVLLDFGVATPIAKRHSTAPTPSGELVGSAAYMAPEQGEATATLPASDWYSVGVVLYEALVGRPPFTGPLIEVLTKKCTSDPDPPSSRVPGVPGDLDTLCMALLQRDPSQRPDGREIQLRLGKVLSLPPPQVAARAPGAFIGRAAQLETLSRAFEAARLGATVAVRIAGEPGMGKSSLVQRFLDDLERDARAVVFRGRAYEREAVPYKAVDGAIDELSDHLVSLEEANAPVEFPSDLWALATLFPVLRRVPSVADDVTQPIVDPHAVRARAFAAFRDLLAGLATSSPLVVSLDDVHWGDLDSATLLLDVMRPPQAPPMLLVMTYRAAERTESPFCSTLFDGWPAGVAVHDIDIGPLDPTDAQSLALTQLDSTNPSAPRIAAAVASESHGSPFLIEELARSNRAAAPGAPLGVLSLETMVAERIEKLPDDARVVLRTIAVAGHPTRTSLIASACDGIAVDQAVGLLVARRFVRTGLRDRFEAVEMVHDRIRETVVGLLEPQVLRQTHEKLVRVLVDAPGIDAEEVAFHALGAGDDALAATFMERAADQAVAGLAFDRAARLFRRAIELLPASSPHLPRNKEHLAEALMYEGRYEDAAQAYLGAAEVAPPDRRIDLRREAAHQLLSGGHIIKARDVLRDVLAPVGLRAPRSTLAAVIWLMIYRVWLAIIGVRYTVLAPDEVPAARRLRIDALYTVVGGFSMVDPIAGACMQARHLIEVLRGADAYRLLRAMVLEVAHAQSSARPETARERELLGAVKQLADRLGSSEATRYATHVRGLTAFQRGRWSEARSLLRRELDTLPYGQPGTSIMRIYLLYTDYYLGDLGGSLKRSRKLLAEAEERGDLYTSVNLLSTSIAAANLADDDAAAARSCVRSALAKWPQTGFFVQHWQVMLYDAYIDLYEGNGYAAYDRFARDWGLVKKSLLLHGAAVRIPALYLRAALAIASIARDPALKAQRIAEARGYVSLLEKETEAWTTVLVALARAMIDDASGDRQGAMTHLRNAEEHAKKTETLIYVPPIRYRLGQLLGDDEGGRLLAEAGAELAKQGVRNPERWVAMHLPGSWRSA